MAVALPTPMPASDGGDIPSSALKCDDSVEDHLGVAGEIPISALSCDARVEDRFSFGRIIERRHMTEDRYSASRGMLGLPLELEACGVGVGGFQDKGLGDCDASASTSSTCRGLSDRTLASVTQVSPTQASLICSAALAEIAVDIVTVNVSASNRGCISGRVMPCHFAEGGQDVVFTLLQVKLGYTVVGEVSTGPEAFKMVCWKLRSWNGAPDVDARRIVKGDILVLEGPRWATSRLKSPLVVDTGEAKPASASSPCRQSVGATNGATALANAASPCSATIEVSSHQPVPGHDRVPRLDLTGIHGGAVTSATSDGGCKPLAMDKFCAEPVHTKACQPLVMNVCQPDPLGVSACLLM